MSISSVVLRSRKKKGQAYAEAGRFQEARDLYQEVTRAAPRDAEAWFMLSALNGQMERYDEAISCGLKAIALQHDYADAHYNLGQAYMHLGRLDEAALAYAEVLKREPGHSHALNTLGLIYAMQCKTGEAVEYYHKALKAKPDNAEAYANLGNALRDMGGAGEAETCYRTALRINPVLIKAQLGLGMTLLSQGRSDEALSAFDAVLAVELGSVEAVAGKAMVLEKQHEFDAALAMLQPLIEAECEQPRVLQAYFNVARHYGKAAEAAAMLEKAVANPVLLPGDKASLCFQLGAYFDKQGDYDTAFEQFRQANAVHMLSYSDPSKSLLRMDEIMRLFDAALFRTAPRAANTSVKPVFIVGMPRSGTTLTEQVLSSHPAVFGAGELPFIGDIAVRLPFLQGDGNAYPVTLEGKLTQALLDEIAGSYLKQIDNLAPPEALRVSDKMPHNFLHLGLIALMFPQAHIIHCKRNPLDTCLSIYTYPFNAQHPYSADMRHLGEHYSKYQQLMQHWKKVLPLPMLEIQYEDMVADQEGMSRKLVEFCGLEWDDNCLRFYENKRVVNTISYDQVRRPIYRKSVERWRNYESHLDALKLALGMEEEKSSSI